MIAAGAVPQATDKLVENKCYPKKVAGNWYALDGSSNPSTAAFLNLIEITPGFYGYDGMSYTGASDAFECPPGHQCLFPFMESWVACPPGTYSVDNASVTYPTRIIPANNANPGGGAVAQETRATTTEANNYWACQPCPDLKSCLQRGNTAIDVESGFFSL